MEEKREKRRGIRGEGEEEWEKWSRRRGVEREEEWRKREGYIRLTVSLQVMRTQRMKTRISCQ